MRECSDTLLSSIQWKKGREWEDKVDQSTDNEEMHPCEQSLSIYGEIGRKGRGNTLDSLVNTDEIGGNSAKYDHHFDTLSGFNKQ